MEEFMSKEYHSCKIHALLMKNDFSTKSIPPIKTNYVVSIKKLVTPFFQEEDD